jgi:hypothetical protein
MNFVYVLGVYRRHDPSDRSLEYATTTEPFTTCLTPRTSFHTAPGAPTENLDPTQLVVLDTFQPKTWKSTGAHSSQARTLRVHASVLQRCGARRALSRSFHEQCAPDGASWPAPRASCLLNTTLMHGLPPVVAKLSERRSSRRRTAVTCPITRPRLRFRHPRPWRSHPSRGLSHAAPRSATASARPPDRHGRTAIASCVYRYAPAAPRCLSRTPCWACVSH